MAEKKKSKRGVSRAHESRGNMLYVRLSDEEKAALDAQCHRTGMSRSAFIRSLVVKEAPVKLIKESDDFRQMILTQFRSEYARQSADLSILVKHVEQGDKVTKDDFDKLVAQQEKILSLVEEWLGQ